MLDFNGTEEVSVQDFVAGCMKLKGHAKSIDVCTILYENRKLACKFSVFTSYMEKQFQRIESLFNLPTMQCPIPQSTRSSLYEQDVASEPENASTNSWEAPSPPRPEGAPPPLGPLLGDQ